MPAAGLNCDRYLFCFCSASASFCRGPLLKKAVKTKELWYNVPQQHFGVKASKQSGKQIENAEREFASRGKRQNERDLRIRRRK